MDFSALIELAQTVTRNKVKHIEVLGNPNQKGSLIENFYHGILDGKITSDETAVQYLYGHDNKKDAAYQQAKKRLTRQLMTTSLFVDVTQPQFNDQQKALHSCYRDFAGANILINRGATKAAVEILEQLLEQCIKFEFIELSADITRYLRMQYVRIYANPQKAEHYTALHRKYEEKRALHMRAFDYYENLVTYYITKRSPNMEIHRIAAKYCEELTPLINKVNTSQFLYFSCQISVIKHMSVNDCLSAIKIIEDTLPVLQTSGNIAKGALFVIAIQKLACLTQLRILNTSAGDETANYCLDICEPGQFNWFRTLETYFYYLTYSNRYEDGLRIYTQAKANPKLEALEGIFRDHWELIGGYLHLLAAFKKLDATEVNQIAGPFKAAKFLNGFKVADKDKVGMNIPLTLLPLLHSLATNTFDQAHISIEAIDKYRQRYLENELNRRSACFVKMLIAYTKLPYEKSAAEKIERELAILNTLQPQVAGQSFAVEIIPYEDIWKMLTEQDGGKAKQEIKRLRVSG